MLHVSQAKRVHNIEREKQKINNLVSTNTKTKEGKDKMTNEITELDCLQENFQKLFDSFPFFSIAFYNLYCHRRHT